MPLKLNLPFLEGYAQTKEMPEHHQRNLVWLCGFLQPDERALVMAILVDGQPIRLAAKLMGQPYMIVRHRILKLAHQLASRKFLAAARLIPHLSPADATLVRLHFCSGQSCRRIARTLGLSHHILRRRFDRVAVRIDTAAQAYRELQRPAQPAAIPAPDPDSGHDSDPRRAAHPRRSRHHRGRALLACRTPDVFEPHAI